MVRNKISKYIIQGTGIMSLLMCMNAFSAPVYAADNNSNIEYFYNESSMDKELKNNVIEQNGTKLTVDKICGSKDKIKVYITVESNQSLKDQDFHNGFSMKVKMDGTDNNHVNTSCKEDGDNKLKFVFNITPDKEFSEKGVIRIDAVYSYLNFNGTLKIPVDFKEDFQSSYTKDLNERIKDSNIQINKFISNNVETGVVVSWPESDNGKASLDDFSNFDKSKFIINVDGKMYVAEHLNGWGGEGNFMLVATDASDYLSYNEVKNAKDISIMNYYNRMTDEESNEFYENHKSEDNICGKLSKGNTEELNSSIKFDDGSEGKIKAVRDNDKVKVYCSSESEKNSLTMAVNVFGGYNLEDDSNRKMSECAIYKDSNKDNQYIVELEDTEKDKDFQIGICKIASKADKFVLGDEIKVK